MEQLLDAIKRQDTEWVRKIANVLFLTRTNQPNKAQINEFEHFAPCKIKLVQDDEGTVFVGKIYYNDLTPFTFG